MLENVEDRARDQVELVVVSVFFRRRDVGNVRVEPFERLDGIVQVLNENVCCTTG